jgi:acyl carrier protein
MTNQTYALIISQTAQEVFRQPSVPFSPGRAFRDIAGFDSILAIQFILAIESAFDITLTEDEVDNMHTMGDLMTLLQSKRSQDIGVSAE